MVVRRPPGFTVDLGFSDSKEVLSIPRRQRAAAIGVWTLCGSWSANKLLDGFVPMEVVRDNGGTPAIVAALYASTLWEPAAGRDGIQFTNWPRWQRTRAEVDAYRKAERDRKAESRGGRATTARRPRDGQMAFDDDDTQAARAAVEHLLNSGNSEMSARTETGPGNGVRSEHREPKTENREEILSRELTAVGSADSPPPLQFPDHCSKHRNDPEPPRCNDCRRVREQNHHADAIEAESAAAHRNREVQRRNDCWDCDPNGLRYSDPNDYDSPLVRCEHPDVP